MRLSHFYNTGCKFGKFIEDDSSHFFFVSFYIDFFFNFYPSPLGLMRIVLDNMIQFVFYEIIMIL
jgi:hypothetical protein